MKKILIAAILITGLAVFIACGDKTSDTTVDTTAANTTAVVTTTTAVNTTKTTTAAVTTGAVTTVNTTAVTTTAITTAAETTVDTTATAETTVTADTTATAGTTVTTDTSVTAVTTAGSLVSIAIPNSESGSGLLAIISTDKPFKRTAESVGDNTTSNTELEAKGFCRITPAVLFNVFLRKDAANALSKMYEAFKTAVGTDNKDKIVATCGYVTTSTTSDHILGYSVDLKIQDASGASYSFNYATKKVGDKTYEQWFKENCAKYGFIYSGVSGETVKTGQFRYVGTVHAGYIMANNLTLEQYVTKIKTDKKLTVEDASDASQWEVIYKVADDGDTTKATFDTSKGYNYSGDNAGGYIIAYKK